MSAKTTIAQPEKLRYSEEHFQGYWIQLQSAIRRDEDADELLDGLIPNPFYEIIDSIDNELA